MYTIGVLNTCMQLARTRNTNNYNIIRKLQCLSSEYWWANNNFGVCVCVLCLRTNANLCSYFVFCRRSYRLYACFCNIRNTEALVCDDLRCNFNFVLENEGWWSNNNFNRCDIYRRYKYDMQLSTVSWL